MKAVHSAMVPVVSEAVVSAAKGAPHLYARIPETSDTSKAVGTTLKTIAVRMNAVGRMDRGGREGGWRCRRHPASQVMSSQQPAPHAGFHRRFRTPRSASARISPCAPARCSRSMRGRPVARAAAPRPPGARPGHAVVVGGGWGGFGAAWGLQAGGWGRVTVLDAAPRPGGVAGEAGGPGFELGVKGCWCVFPGGVSPRPSCSDWPPRRRATASSTCLATQAALPQHRPAARRARAAGRRVLRAVRGDSLLELPRAGGCESGPGGLAAPARAPGAARAHRRPLHGPPAARPVLRVPFGESRWRTAEYMRPRPAWRGTDRLQNRLRRSWSSTSTMRRTQSTTPSPSRRCAGRPGSRTACTPRSWSPCCWPCCSCRRGSSPLRWRCPC